MSIEQEAKQVLAEAADLLAPAGAWLQGRMARSAAGKPIACTDPAAACFCAFGAIYRVTHAKYGSSRAGTGVQTKALELLGLAHGLPRISDWNDAADRTQAEVVDAFRRAAA